jgi:hypothetical protein
VGARTAYCTTARSQLRSQRAFRGEQRQNNHSLFCLRRFSVSSRSATQSMQLGTTSCSARRSTRATSGEEEDVAALNNGRSSTVSSRANGEVRRPSATAAPSVVAEGTGQTRFTCWRNSIGTAGTHAMTLMFYGEANTKGAHLLIASEAAEYLGLAGSTVRSAAQRHGIPTASMAERREMDALRRIGAVQPNATKVCVMAVKGFGQAVRKIQNFDKTKLLELEALAKAMPPPSRYLPGDTHIPQHPATHGLRTPATVQNTLIGEDRLAEQGGTRPEHRTSRCTPAGALVTRGDSHNEARNRTTGARAPWEQGHSEDQDEEDEEGEEDEPHDDPYW